MWGEEVHDSSKGVAYRRAGSGPSVLLLHGIPGSAASWEPVATRLPDTFDVIVPDLLGFGDSNRPRSLEELHARGQAGALADLLAELGVDRVSVIGHDFGGPIALMLNAGSPGLIDGLGLLATNAFTDTPIPFPLSLTTAPLVGPLAQRALFSGPSLRMMLRQGIGRGSTPLDPRTHVGDRDQQRAIATIFAGSLTRLTELYEPVEAALDAVDVPAFVGWGDRDPFFDLAQGERTAEAIGVELHVYEGAGHFLPHERPNDVVAEIVGLVGRTSRT